MAYTRDYNDWKRKQIQFEGSRRDEFQRRSNEELIKKSHEEYMKRHRERLMAPPAPTLVRDKKKKKK